MKPQMLSIALIAIVLLNFHSAFSVQYEPPINVVFIVHVEDMGWAPYTTRIEFLEWLSLQAQTRPNPFKLTILMNGDFAETAWYNGDQPFFADLEAEGHELGTHAHNIIWDSPLHWIQVGEQTCRFGVPLYNHDITLQIWSDARRWVDSLTTSNQTICAFPFLCSTESELMTTNSYIADPGNRSEKGLDYLGHLVRHPFRPAGDDRLGHEIEEDLSNSFIYIDHYAQIGNEDAHGYNCTVPFLMEAFDECYDEWLAEEMVQGDSLDYKVWTFGFLTHLYLYSPYYQQQITSFLDYLDSLYVNHFTPRGNQIARYATCHEVVEEYLAWEQFHPGESSFSYVYPYPQIPLINEAMIVPEDSLNGSEWVEIYNPMDQWMNISGYKISDGFTYGENFWRFPSQSWLGPHIHLVAAGNGVLFRQRYGFRPDFEVAGSTGARVLEAIGYYILHDQSDGCVLSNIDLPAPVTYTTITDGLSWGEDYVAGFTLPQPVVNHTYGRDAFSNDTGYSEDWSLNGSAPAPTPDGANSASYFSPELFVRTELPWVPMQVSPSGGTIQFIGTFGNEFPTVQNIDVWTNVVLPNGNIYGPLILRQNRNLAPQDSFNVEISQAVPGSAPAGFYRYNLYLGMYPSSPFDYSYFYFQKMGAVEGSDAVWCEPIFDGWDDSENSAPLSSQTSSFLTIEVSPNPFNLTTNITFSLPRAGHTQLTVYDCAGRLVFQRFYPYLHTGAHTVPFGGQDLSSGVYILRLDASEQNISEKILLIK